MTQQDEDLPVQEGPRPAGAAAEDSSRAEGPGRSDRNIVLCSDGTGNKGGYGAATNVFKIYNAADIHDPHKEQLVFYDNGVGTSANKYWRAVTGAFGIGFYRNVCDLYEFLARNYRPGDKVFLFGFSRGAATVRALAGMIGVCGLVDIRSHCWNEERGFPDEHRFQDLIEQAMTTYRHHRSPRGATAAADFRQRYAFPLAPEGAFAIDFIGVWDTVSALGFPRDWSYVVDWFFRGFEWLADSLFPHSFYNYQAGPYVKRVCHALAIDDERKTFHPKVWDEVRDDRPVEIEQVWFAGVHSNVGGGYPRAGLSNVALDWMMERAEKQAGLRFKSENRTAARSDANVFGRLFDSRDGLALYYRYAPRDIEKLCVDRKGKRVLQGPVQIHESVFRRMKYKTAGYAPGQLPYAFDSVSSALDPAGRPAVPTRAVSAAPTDAEWKQIRGAIERWVSARKGLYLLFAEGSFLLFLAAMWFWYCPPASVMPGDGENVVVAALRYVTPTALDGLISYLAVKRPLAGFLVAGFFVALLAVRIFLRRKTEIACETARRSVLRQVLAVPAPSGDRGVD